MKNKHFERFASYIIAFLLPFVVIYLSFLYLFFSVPFYKHAFIETGVYHNFANKTIVDSKLDEVLQFMKDQGSLDSSFFSSQAINHLTDVRKLINGIERLTLLYSIILISLIVYLISRSQCKRLGKGVLFGSAVTIGSIFILQIGIVQNFDLLFFQFHKAIFSNNLWLFPGNDNLIKLFPQAFFVLFAQQLAQTIIVVSAIIFGIGFVLWRSWIPQLAQHKKGKRR